MSNTNERDATWLDIYIIETAFEEANQAVEDACAKVDALPEPRFFNKIDLIAYGVVGTLALLGSIAVAKTLVQK